MAQEHRIVDTVYGEVMCRYAYDCDTNRDFLDCYIGDNYDEYIGEISGSLYESDESIAEKIEALM